jgi:hypothetical protein
MIPIMPIRRNRFTKGVVLSLLFMACFAGFSSCTNPVTPPQRILSWDTTFIIGNIQFPNDSIYNRTVVSMGSLWRTHRFIDRCKSQPSVCIGFIGGSITKGAMASTPLKRYSSAFCSSLINLFPNLKNIREINAGISATGSRFGCSRLRVDILDSMPDLIIIEFAVNDSGVGDSTYIRDCMEGLVRQCLVFRDDVPVILLFMPKADGTNVQKLHADVGGYYSLPMLSFRNAIWPVIEQNWAEFDTFFYDDPHPNDNGHWLCGYLLYSFFKKAMAIPEGQAIAVPAFKFSDIYQHAAMIDEGDTIVTAEQSGWEPFVKEKSRTGFTCATDSALLILSGYCNEMTIGINTHPLDTSIIRIIVDNGISDTALSDYNAFEYTKFVRLYFSETTGAHRVKIIHQGSGVFTINYLLYAKKTQPSQMAKSK